MPRTTSGNGTSQATGREIHDRVAGMIRENPGMTQTAAFAALAEEDGRSPANIAANFYRVQRQLGGGRSNGNGGSTRRGNTGNGRRRARGRTRAQVSETEQMLDRIERDVRDALETLAVARAGLAEAREAQERVEAVRAALA